MLRAETEEEERDVDVEEVRGGAGATADRFSDRSVSRAVDDDEEEDVGRSEGMLRDGFTGAVESVGAVELVMSCGVIFCWRERVCVSKRVVENVSIDVDFTLH